MAAALRVLGGVAAVMLAAAVTSEGRPTAVAKREVSVSLSTGDVTLPAGTQFEILEDSGAAEVLLAHPLGEVRVPRSELRIDAVRGEEPGATTTAIRPGEFLFPSPETQPGRTTGGDAVATWDKVTYLPVTIAGIGDRVSRMGDGSTGVVVFAPHHARNIKILLRAEVQLLREVTGGETSLFVFSYPDFLGHQLLPRVLRSYLRGRHEARADLRGLASSLVAQIREQTGLEQLLLVGNSFGASMLLADYADLARDERNSFLLISPMEACLPPTEKIGPLVRTTLLANEATDPFTQGGETRGWLAANKDRRVLSALEQARDRSDPMVPPLDTGHLVLGDQIDSRLLFRLVAWRLGMTGLEELEQPLAQPSFEFKGRKVILESIGWAPRTIVLFDPRAPLQRKLHRAQIPHELGSYHHQAATIVSWGFAEGSSSSGPVPGLAGELVRELRQSGRQGPIVLHGVAAWAAQLLTEYDELSKLPGVSLVLLAPPEEAMGPPPWPELDPAFAWLLANDRSDPTVRSDEFRAWVAANRHPLTDSANRGVWYYDLVNRVPTLPAANAEALAGRSASPHHDGSLVERLWFTIFGRTALPAVDLLIERETRAKTVQVVTDP
jgi:pimeloyl-ACP methyl ester carboxylesterase